MKILSIKSKEETWLKLCKSYGVNTDALDLRIKMFLWTLAAEDALQDFFVEMVAQFGGYRPSYYINAHPYSLEGPINDRFTDFMKGAFVWNNTKQGGEYWLKISLTKVIQTVWK